MDTLGLYFFMLGLGLGLLYLLLSPLRSCRAARFLTPLSDIFFFLCAAVSMILLFSHLNNGRVRLYAISAAALGVSIFRMLIAAPLRALGRAVAKIRDDPSASGALAFVIRFILR